MKNIIFITIAVLTVVACTGVSIVEYNKHKTKVAAEQTSEVQKAYALTKLHDAVNQRLLNEANSAKATTSSKLNTLCAQVKGTKLYTPALCQ